MAGVAGSPHVDGPEQDASTLYDAFISYSHADQTVAVQVQKALHRIGRKRGQLRALRVFLDSTDLTASPDLWGEVREALHRSRYLVVLLSPNAAASEWVPKEYAEWVDRNGTDEVLIGVAAGVLDYDPEQQCFSADSTAALTSMRQPGAFDHEPLFVNLRDMGDMSSRSPLIRERLVALAAPLHGIERRALFDAEVREYRKGRRLRIAFACLLALLMVIASVAAVYAMRQQRVAEQQRATAIAQRNQAVATALASSSRETRTANPALALALADEAIHAAPDSGTAQAALLQARIAFDHAPAIPMRPASFGQGFGADAVAVSPSGATFAVGGGGATSVNLYDIGSGRRVGGVTTPYSVDALAFSPDATQLAMATYQGLYVLTPSGLTKVGHIGTDNVYDVAFDPQGRFLLVSRGRGVEVLQADGDHRPLRRLLRLDPYRSPTAQIAVNATGTRVAVAVGPRLSVWTVDADGTLGRERRHALPYATGTADAGTIAFVRQTKVIAVGGDKVAVFDADSGYRWAIRNAADDTFYRGVTAGQDGRVFLYGDSGDVVVLDAGLARIGEFTVDADEVLSAALSPDGHALVVGGGTGSVTVWDVSRDRRLGPPPFAGDGYNSSGVILDGSHVVANGHGRKLLEWTAGPDATSPYSPGEELGRGRTGLLFVDASEDRTVVTATSDEDLLVRRDGQTSSLRPGPRQSFSSPARLSSDGSIAVAGVYDGPLVVIDTASAEITDSFDAGSRIMDLDVTRDGSTAAAGLFSGSVMVVSLRDGATHLIEPELGNVQAVAFAPDGDLVVAGTTGRLTLLDPDDGAVVRSFESGVGGRVEVARFTRDGELLLTGGSDNALRIWRVSTGEELATMPTVGQYASEVGSIDIGPDGGSVMWSEDEHVVLFPGLLDLSAADCDVVRPYLTAPMVQRYLPEGREPVCDYS